MNDSHRKTIVIAIVPNDPGVPNDPDYVGVDKIRDEWKYRGFRPCPFLVHQYDYPPFSSYSLNLDTLAVLADRFWELIRNRLDINFVYFPRDWEKSNGCVSLHEMCEGQGFNIVREVESFNRYCSKLNDTEAIKYSGANFAVIKDWLERHKCRVSVRNEQTQTFTMVSGNNIYSCNISDYIVHHIYGSFEVMTDEWFRSCYSPIRFEYAYEKIEETDERD